MTQVVEDELREGFGAMEPNELLNLLSLFEKTLEPLYISEERRLSVLEYREYLFDYLLERRLK